MTKLFNVAARYVCCAVALFVAFTGCKYDDTELWNKVNDIEGRLEKVEKQVASINKDIESLQKIVEGTFTIVKVEENENGHTIQFSDGTSIEIKDGKDGIDGKDAPVIGVKKDEDGKYYWTLTSGGKTEYLTTSDGQKLPVTADAVIPVLGVDEQGYWTISFDGGATSQRIKDAEGNDVLAKASSEGGDSLFRGVTVDGNIVYFELADGSVISVALRGDFYMLIRKAPQTSTFSYGETQTYEVEETGVSRVIVSKPDGWRVKYENKTLKITAPTLAMKDYAEFSGTVSLIYMNGDGLSDCVEMQVVAEPAYIGETKLNNFTVNITAIDDKSVTATVTPKDASVRTYVVAYDKAKYDSITQDAFINEQLGMFNFYLQYGYTAYFDVLAPKGEREYKGSNLKADKEYYIAVFSFEEDLDAKVCKAVTDVEVVPFKTKHEIVINTVYRIDVSDVTWNSARYVCVPSDDRGYFHGFVKKSEFDTYESDDAFIKSRIEVYSNAYRDELLEGTVTWAQLTSTGTQTMQAAKYYTETKAATLPLVEDTEYYVYAFCCVDGNAASPLSKVEFKTGKFKATKECEFKIESVVTRQDVVITVTPSASDVTYLVGVDKRDYFDDFENPLQYAVDDLIWTEVFAQEAGKTLEASLLSGKQTIEKKNLWGATAYRICVYGCTPEGVITTYPIVAEFLTQGSIDKPTE